MKINSLKFEISVLYTAILGIVLMVFSGILYLTSNALIKQSDHQLKAKAEAIDLMVRDYHEVLGEGPESFMAAVEKTVALKIESGLANYRLRRLSQEWFKRVQHLNLSRDYIHVVSREGMSLFSSDNLSERLRKLFLDDVHVFKANRPVYTNINYQGRNIRLIHYPMVGIEEDRYFIQVGFFQEPVMQILQNWLYAMAVSIPAILLLTTFLGRKLASRILVPVQEITDMARRISLRDLSARIKAKNFDSEMGTLVEAFNDMIARLEKSFKHIEEFSYHVAHELKTPLTIIKGEAELLLRKERSKQEYQKALKITIEETQRVLKTVEDLLLLTKLDYQPEIFKFEQFDFIEFFKEIFEQTKILAGKKSIRVSLKLDETQYSIMLQGDKVHLRRLFLNIIDNAIKYTPEKGHITLVVTSIPQKIVASISDDGPGISDAHLPRIFERFYRTETSPSGNGLGLNIAQTIARIHEGEITVDSKVGAGTTFHVALPTL